MQNAMAGTPANGPSTPPAVTSAFGSRVRWPVMGVLQVGQAMMAGGNPGVLGQVRFGAAVGASAFGAEATATFRCATKLQA